MIKLNQAGAVNGVLISLILTVVLLVAALGFGGWAFSSRQDYKQHSDDKVAAAVKVAKQQESAAKDAVFAEEAKNPLKTYVGPEAYGSLNIVYPKTWSGYVDTSGSTNAVDGYFAPGVVPSVSAQGSVFALRVQVLNQAYAQTIQTFTGLEQDGKVKAVAYALPKLPKVTGIEVTGQITSGSNATMVVLPLRAQTLEIWTQGDQYLDDFNKNILPNFSFSP